MKTTKSNMCEALEGLIEDGRKDGRKEGRKEGKFTALLNLIKSGVITLKQAADSLNMSEKSFKNNCLIMGMLYKKRTLSNGTKYKMERCN